MVDPHMQKQQAQREPMSSQQRAQPQSVKPVDAAVREFFMKEGGCNGGCGGCTGCLNKFGIDPTKIEGAKLDGLSLDDFRDAKLSAGGFDVSALNDFSSTSTSSQIQTPAQQISLVFSSTSTAKEPNQDKRSSSFVPLSSLLSPTSITTNIELYKSQKDQLLHDKASCTVTTSQSILQQDVYSSLGDKQDHKNDHDQNDSPPSNQPPKTTIGNQYVSNDEKKQPEQHLPEPANFKKEKSQDQQYFANPSSTTDIYSAQHTNTTQSSTTYKPTDQTQHASQSSSEKKQYVVGTYTYDDIISSAWLRKLYGHMIGLQDVSEDITSSSNDSLRFQQDIKLEEKSNTDNEKGDPPSTHPFSFPLMAKTKAKKKQNQNEPKKEEIPTILPAALAKFLRKAKPSAREADKQISQLNKEIKNLEKKKSKSKSREEKHEVQERINKLKRKREELKRKAETGAKTETKKDQKEAAQKNPLDVHTYVSKLLVSSNLQTVKKELDILLKQIQKEIDKLKQRLKTKKQDTPKSGLHKKLVELIKARKLVLMLIFHFNSNKKKGLFAKLQELIKKFKSRE